MSAHFASWRQKGLERATSTLRRGYRLAAQPPTEIQTGRGHL